MAKYRMIQIDYWEDPIVAEEMTVEEKCFYLYLLTNSKTKQTGIYRIMKRQIAFDIGLPMDTVDKLMERFIHVHKLIRYNFETREIAIKNWGRDNLHKGGKPVMDCIASELKTVIDTSLIQYVADQIPKKEIRDLYESFCTPEEPVSHEESEETETEENASIEMADNANEASSRRLTIRPQKEKENKKEKQQQKQKPSVPYREQEPNQETDPDIEVQVQNQQSSDVQEIIAFWDNNGFGYSNLNAKEQLLSWLDHSSFLQPKEMMLKALEISCAMNKRRLNYVLGILKNWENESLLTIDEVEAYDDQHSLKKNREQRESFSGGRDVPRDFVFDITAGEEE